MQSNGPLRGAQNRQILPMSGANLRETGAEQTVDLRSRPHAEALDRTDDLTRFRDQFYLPRGQIYLDGNSLGLLCRPAEAAVLAVMEHWRTLAIEGWTAGESPWFFLAEELAKL